MILVTEHRPRARRFACPESVLSQALSLANAFCLTVLKQNRGHGVMPHQPFSFFLLHLLRPACSFPRVSPSLPAHSPFNRTQIPVVALSPEHPLSFSSLGNLMVPNAACKLFLPPRICILSMCTGHTIKLRKFWLCLWVWCLPNSYSVPGCHLSALPMHPVVNGNVHQKASSSPSPLSTAHGFPCCSCSSFSERTCSASSSPGMQQHGSSVILSSQVLLQHRPSRCKASKVLWYWTQGHGWTCMSVLAHVWIDRCVCILYVAFIVFLFNRYGFYLYLFYMFMLSAQNTFKMYMYLSDIWNMPGIC